MKRYWSLIMTIIALSVLVGFSPGQAALTDNLIGYWAFDGSGADGSGNGRPVNLYGDATYGTGLFDQALSLPGKANSYAARMINDAAFNLGSSDFTIQVWVKFRSHDTQVAFIEKFTGDAGPGWTLCYPGGIQFYAKPAGVADTFGLIVSLDTWYQLIVRRQGTALDIFVNDGVPSQGTISGSIPDSPNPLLIGRREGFQEFPLDGLIDEAAIWSRALSDQEITYL